MSFLLDHCCLKLNYLVCGSKESAAAAVKKKRTSKASARRQGPANDVCSTSKVFTTRPAPTPINASHQHYVNVSPAYYTVRQHDSLGQFDSWNSCLDQRAPSIVSNGITIRNVVLRRASPNERLGLTLCYGITSKSTTNIYIQQVEPASIAGQHGELRSGDQIIKINNHRVTSRDEAINLVNGACRILLQIVRFEVSCSTFVPVASETPLTEDDSGVILACHTDFDTGNERTRQRSTYECQSLGKSCISLSSSGVNHCANCRRNQSFSRQFQYRRCLSLNDLRPCAFVHDDDDDKPLIRSQSLVGAITDNEQVILKPLPFTHPPPVSIERREDSDSGLVCGRSRSNDSRGSRHNPNQWTLKHFRRRYREQRLREQYQTTDDEPMSELKQGRYWTRQQRKEHLAKARQYRERAKFFQQHSVAPCSDSATEDFNMLNRIFIRENRQELHHQPYLAYKYGQQSSMERKKLKRMIQQHYFDRVKAQSTTTVSISSTIDQPAMAFL